MLDDVVCALAAADQNQICSIKPNRIAYMRYCTEFWVTC